MSTDVGLQALDPETGKSLWEHRWPTPREHRELARFQVLTGKTWNHPVVTQGRLLVRNAEEAACFQL